MGCNEWQDNPRNKKSRSPGIEQRDDGKSSITWAEWWDDLRRFAFGWIGLSPHQFYNMDNEDFFLTMRGMKDRIIDQKRDLRRMALIIVSPHVKDMPSAMRIWPIEKDEELKGEILKGEKLTQEESMRNFKALAGMFKKRDSLN